ncbi:phage terminase small subunit [Ectopseudomonas mendocina]|uniref:Terminase n=1 Tax=Ectopseudomonas mendocina TaxID=300 RepID=A0A2R3QVE4_ECTME|nr:phage terminase small subunit [Pseudomonas mendocina]AVO55727.1 terminase [Pseudomonas mendocina]
MASLAQRTQLRKRAEAESARTAPPALMDGLTTYELMLAKLQQDNLRLKQVQSNQNKALLKAEMLPEYADYVAGVLAGGKGAQDEVFVTVMLWRFDAGDFIGGLEAAAYVLQHALKMPERFNRTTGCVVAEEIAEAALRALKAGNGFDIEITLQANELTARHDMPDAARAKLMLAIGRLYALKVKDDASGEDLGNLVNAKEYLSKAISLYSACGAKKDMERVDRLLKKHADNG